MSVSVEAYNVDVATADGAMDCYIARPEGSGSWGAVILYMDVPGIREELEAFTRRIAGEGYVCVLPDLYYREGRVRFDLSKGEAELKRMFAVGSQLTNAMVVSDTAGILAHLDGLAEARAATGTIGYCMSGQFVLSVASAFPERIRASASLYGTRMVTDADDSPHKGIPAITGEFYLGFAAHDPYVEDFVVPTLQRDLAASGVTFELDTFPDTEHGFCFPQRPAYVETAAETVWEKVFAMYQRCLGE